MSRATSGVTTRARHKKIIKLAKGYRGRSKNCFTVASRRVAKALQYAYRDRRARKRDFRALWIQRINAGARLHDITYSRLMDGLNKAGIEINRKMLSEIAIHQPDTFKNLVDQAKAAL